MTTSEHQLEAIIGKCVFHINLFFIRLFFLRRLEHDRNVILCHSTTEPINGTTFRNCHEPCARVAWNAFLIPTFECIYKCILQGIFCQHKITQLADERSKDTSIFFAEGGFNLGSCGHVIYRWSRYALRYRSGLLDQRDFPTPSAPTTGGLRWNHILRLGFSPPNGSLRQG